MVRLG